MLRVGMMRSVAITEGGRVRFGRRLLGCRVREVVALTVLRAGVRQGGRAGVAARCFGEEEVRVSSWRDDKMRLVSQTEEGRQATGASHVEVCGRPIDWNRLDLLYGDRQSPLDRKQNAQKDRTLQWGFGELARTKES